MILIDAADYLLRRGRSDSDPGRRPQRARPAAGQFIIGSVVSFFHLPNDTICAYIGDGQIAVLKASNTQESCQLGRTGRCPTTEFSSSWANLAPSNVPAMRCWPACAATRRLDQHRHRPLSPGPHGPRPVVPGCRVALLLGRRFQGHNRVHCLDELGVAAFVGVADERPSWIWPCTFSARWTTNPNSLPRWIVSSRPIARRRPRRPARHSPQHACLPPGQDLPR